MSIANNNPENANVKTSLANNSGQGPNTPVLDVIAKKFNWGACFLQWIWGLGNRTFITLIVLLVCWIPFIGGLAVMGCSIWFGFKGNEWAWQNKRWQSIEHFHSVQRKWAIAGTIYSIIIALITGILATFVLVLGADSIKKEMERSIEAQTEIVYDQNTEPELPNLITVKKAVNTLKEATLGNKVMEVTCDGSSEDLASYFSERINKATQTGNQVETNFGVFTFDGDEECLNAGDCNVTFTDNESTNETIPLSIDDDGYVVIHAEEVLAKYENQ